MSTSSCTQSIIETIPRSCIEYERGQRSDAGVLNKWPGTEIASLQSAKPAGLVAKCEGCASYPSKRAGNTIARGVKVREARASVGDIKSERQGKTAISAEN